MQQYELTVLVQPDLEPEIDNTIKALHTLIKDAGGKVLSEENWGKKRLAYPITKQNFGVYLYMEVELPAEAPKKLSDVLNITDYALRYLLVKVDEKERTKREASKKESANAEEQE